jgi:hypothetical protein
LCINLVINSRLHLCCTQDAEFEILLASDCYWVLTLAAERQIASLVKTPLGHIHQTAVRSHALVPRVLVVELAVFVLTGLPPVGDGWGWGVIRQGKKEHVGERLRGSCNYRNLSGGACAGGACLSVARSALRALSACLHAQFQSITVVHTTWISRLLAGAARHRAFTPVWPLYFCNTNTQFVYAKSKHLPWYKRENSPSNEYILNVIVYGTINICFGIKLSKFDRNSSTLQLETPVPVAALFKA